MFIVHVLRSSTTELTVQGQERGQKKFPASTVVPRQRGEKKKGSGTGRKARQRDTTFPVPTHRAGASLRREVPAVCGGGGYLCFRPCLWRQRCPLWSGRRLPYGDVARVEAPSRGVGADPPREGPAASGRVPPARGRTRGLPPAWGGPSCIVR
jgi:hypothetical protein